MSNVGNDRHSKDSMSRTCVYLGNHVTYHGHLKRKIIDNDETN